MNSLTLRRCALSVCAAASLLVGCGGLQPAGVTQGPAPQGQMPGDPSRVSGVRQSPGSVRHASVTETVLYSFGEYANDGVDPMSGLTYFNGTLYGTTFHGGNYCGYYGCGTVYSVTPSGTETVLHSFSGGKDGSLPDARPIVLNGTLYGTTQQGGGNYACVKPPVGNCGTVYSITPSGNETILYAFAGSPDGSMPKAPLRNVNGTLYGTTSEGGTGASRAAGTAFTIAPSGDEHVIHTFHYRKGAPPSRGRLVDLNGTLYGTASEGGEYNEGIVFALSTSGREQVLHSFPSSSKDGAFPNGGLVAVKHTLYGTTSHGGGPSCFGTVFSITPPSGSEIVLHSFCGSDGGPQKRHCSMSTAHCMGRRLEAERMATGQFLASHYRGSRPFCTALWADRTANTPIQA